jgi:hypothetical protein
MGADCGDETLIPLSGQIMTEGDSGVEGARVAANNFTDVNGNYSLLVKENSNVEIRPFLDRDVANGVSTLDILLIQRHILGVQLLDSPYKLIAADANKSASISAADLVEIRKVILGKSESFVNNTSWRFVARNYEFRNPTTAFSENFAESILLSAPIVELYNLDFYGIKIGDVNGSAKANSQSVNGSTSRSRSLDLNVADVNMVAGND